MNDASPPSAAGLYLVTLGTPALLAHGVPISLRKKDLALLVYLRLEGRHGHSRATLSGLLWGSSPEENARHSLTQALGRLRARLGEGVLEVGHGRVGCRATLPCDAASLVYAAVAPDIDDEVLALCAGEFLAGFGAGPGAEAFESWADGRRAHLRTVAVTALDRLGAEGEARGDWDAALAAAQRAVELDPASEPAHRRIMRAWAAREHRVRALQHYDRLTAWLAAEFETDPEPQTAQLAEQLRARAVPAPVAAAAQMVVPRLPRPAHRMEPLPQIPRLASVRARVHWAWGGVAGLAVLLAVLWNSGTVPGLGGADDPDAAHRPPLRPPLALPGTPVERLEDWLRTDGRWIYYRYGVYMPGACDHTTRAVGSWGPDGWSVGVAVHCVDEEWLAVDVERLSERFALEPSTTFCLNFVYLAGNASHWGQHGSRGAPGLDDIRVVAPNGAYNIGFAIVRDGPGQRRVVLTNAYSGPRC